MDRAILLTAAQYDELLSHLRTSLSCGLAQAVLDAAPVDEEGARCIRELLPQVVDIGSVQEDFKRAGRPGALRPVLVLDARSCTEA